MSRQPHKTAHVGAAELLKWHEVVDAIVNAKERDTHYEPFTPHGVCLHCGHGELRHIYEEQERCQPVGVPALQDYARHIKPETVLRLIEEVERLRS